MDLQFQFQMLMRDHPDHRKWDKLEEIERICREGLARAHEEDESEWTDEEFRAEISSLFNELKAVLQNHDEMEMEKNPQDEEMEERAEIAARGRICASAFAHSRSLDKGHQDF